SLQCSHQRLPSPPERQRSLRRDAEKECGSTHRTGWSAQGLYRSPENLSALRPQRRHSERARCCYQRQPPHQDARPGISLQKLPVCRQMFYWPHAGRQLPLSRWLRSKSPRGNVLAKCHSEPETLFLLKIIMPRNPWHCWALFYVFFRGGGLFRRKLTPPDNFTDFPVFQGIVRRH